MAASGLWPTVRDERGLAALRRRGHSLLAGVAAIARRHGWERLPVAPFADGSLPVFALAEERVLKLYDFNLMPQHLHAPNPFVWLALRLGLRRKSHRDYRNLKKWELRGRNAS